MVGHLSPSEWRELTGLMRWARFRHLPPSDERRLRELVAVHDGKARDMPWDDLVRLGLVILGCHFLHKALK